MQAGGPSTPDPTAGTWSAKMRKTQDGLATCNDTQEIAKSFWSYFYGGLS
jgi:hypothetical protein